MIKEILKSKLSRAALALTLIWLILYFGLSAAIFKNMWHPSPALPLLGAVLAFLPLIAEILNLFLLKNHKLEIALVIICPALGLAHFFFFAYVLSKLTYFLIAGAPYFITTGLGGLVAFFVFLYPSLSKLWKKITAISLSVVLAIICLTSLFGAVPFYIDGGATVFATDSEYQIAFSTSHKSVGSVEVNGKMYYDQKDGENNVSKLHKISVPTAELDGARKYSVRTQGVALNTAYLPPKGAVIEKEYNFRPIDESDGIQIYNLSDTHEVIAGPAKAAAYFGDKLDLLILNGDIINDVSSEYQISLIYKLAHRVTKGGRPVIYTRGNHECNGKLASKLSDYVGSTENGMYFDYKIGNTLSLLVLDTANDMADDNPLISPIANFDLLRKQQTEWLKARLPNDCEINFAVAHMAYPLSGYQSEKCAWHEFARELVELTDVDFALCGHSHRTDATLPATPDNAVADFPVIRGSIRSNRYPDKEGVSPFEFTGTAIEIVGGEVTFKFTNAKKQVLGTYKGA